MDENQPPTDGPLVANGGDVAARSRRGTNIKWAIAVIVLSLVLVAGGAIYLLTAQPDFYRRVSSENGSREDRHAQSKRLTQATLQLFDDVRHQEQWSQQFTEEQVNGWLAEELPGQYAELLPAGVEQPRVHFDDDALYIGFRTRRGLWSGVVSAQLKVWVAEPNQLACEIQSLQAGLVPIPVDDMLDDFVDGLNRSGWRVSWKTDDGADVLVVRFDDDALGGHTSERPVLEAVEVAPGKLRVAGTRANLMK